MQEALQKCLFDCAAAGRGASGGSADRIQVFETGQVLREEMSSVVEEPLILIRQLSSHDHSSASVHVWLRWSYLVQIAVQDSTVPTVSLSAGMAPG